MRLQRVRCIRARHQRRPEVLRYGVGLLKDVRHKGRNYPSLLRIFDTVDRFGTQRQQSLLVGGGDVIERAKCAAAHRLVWLARLPLVAGQRGSHAAGQFR